MNYCIVLLIIPMINCYKLYMPQGTETPKDFVTPSEYRIESLNAHNEYRKAFDSTPLVLNESLCERSQYWANQLIHFGKSGHQGGGENLSGGPRTVTGRYHVDSYYSEIEFADFLNMNKHFYLDDERTILHFTQVIWKESTSYCASFAFGKDQFVTVSNYWPHGNVDGGFERNVKPLKSGNAYVAMNLNPARLGKFNKT